MTAARRLAFVLLAVAAVAAQPKWPPPAVPSAAEAEPYGDWDEKFTRTEGWVGGDAAYSVAVSPTRTVWLFGDTWVGAVKNGSRAGSAMVNNTVAIQDGNGPDARLSFPIRRDKSDRPVSQFLPADGKGFLWPLAGTFHAGKLYLFLAQVEHTKEGGALGFKQVAQWVGVVSNPADPPAAWKLTQTKLPFCRFDDDRIWTFGSAVVQADGFAYVYGYDENPRRGFNTKYLILARVPLDKVADVAAWEFHRDGGWKPWADGFPGRMHLAGGVAAEMSVHYIPALKKYLLVYTDNGLSDQITGNLAETPEGPWSGKGKLYTCPEMKADKKLFSYAGKAHPHLCNGTELVVSYCVNSYDLARVVNDPTVYRPRFVRLTVR
ncbi:MAG: DUF4185 domain-containing protein [Gemmataceae bacterium]|nr:DUF4185 domain-containing protein [Gemmataceae bacterium]